MPISFHETQMGHRFYEYLVPHGVKQLERIAGALERIAVQLEKKNENSEGGARSIDSSGCKECQGTGDKSSSHRGEAAGEGRREGGGGD